MSYTTDKRVELLAIVGVEVRVHQDRGDGTALCAIGTQYPNAGDYTKHGRGEVNSRPVRPVEHAGGACQREESKACPRPADRESLDERAARMKAKKDENA